MQARRVRFETVMYSSRVEYPRRIRTLTTTRVERSASGPHIWMSESMAHWQCAISSSITLAFMQSPKTTLHLSFSQALLRARGSNNNSYCSVRLPVDGGVLTDRKKDSGDVPSPLPTPQHAAQGSLSFAPGAGCMSRSGLDEFYRSVGCRLLARVRFPARDGGARLGTRPLNTAPRQGASGTNVKLCSALCGGLWVFL